MADRMHQSRVAETDAVLDGEAMARKDHLRSPIIKRTVVIGRRKTSISLEDEFWNAFRALAQERITSPSKMVAEIDGGRQCGNLSSAIRLFVLRQYAAMAKANKRRAPASESRGPHPE